MSDPHVLLVDDDEAVLELTSELLRMAGYEVTALASANQALARLRAGERFDALVSDQSMPDMRGDTLIRAAREAVPGLACLLITGFGAADDIDDIAVLHKPYRVGQLDAAIRAQIAAG